MLKGWHPHSRRLTPSYTHCTSPLTEMSIHGTINTTTDLAHSRLEDTYGRGVTRAVEHAEKAVMAFEAGQAAASNEGGHRKLMGILSAIGINAASKGHQCFPAASLGSGPPGPLSGLLPRCLRVAVEGIESDL